MALKLSVVLSVFVLVAAVMMAAAPPVAEAQSGNGIIRGLLGLIRVRGTLFCSPDGNINNNASSTPFFSRAMVQLRCGNETIISTSITNRQGVFSILLDPLQFIVSTLLSNCNLVVNTPLSSCNATLPTLGTLFSPLQFIGNTPLGLINIANLIPSGFQLL